MGTARVRLNWQAKLMPVTRSRFSEAAGSNIKNSDMETNVDEALKFFDPLVTH